jgi:hypothetical protein
MSIPKVPHIMNPEIKKALYNIEQKRQEPLLAKYFGTSDSRNDQQEVLLHPSSLETPSHCLPYNI